MGVGWTVWLWRDDLQLLGFIFLVSCMQVEGVEDAIAVGGKEGRGEENEDGNLFGG